MATEKVAGGLDVNDFVKLLRSDVKEVQKKNKIKGIVLFSVQEALKIASITSITGDTFKSEQTRKVIIQVIEAQLRFAGYVQTIAVFGNKFSYEAKSSRHTMSLFTVGQAPSPIFHIMIYDLAYINVPNIIVSTDSEFQAKLKSIKQGLPT